MAQRALIDSVLRHIEEERPQAGQGASHLPHNRPTYICYPESSEELLKNSAKEWHEQILEKKNIFLAAGSNRFMGHNVRNRLIGGSSGWW